MHTLISAMALCALAGSAFAAGGDDPRTVRASGLFVSHTADTAGDARFDAARVNVRGRIGGDLEASGALVRGDAQVDGRVQVDAGRMHFRGAAVHGAEINAGTANIGGQYGGDVRVDSGTLFVDRDTHIAGDLHGSVGLLRLNGVVQGALHARLGRATVNGRVSGPARIRAGGSDNRGVVRINGALDGGGWICAREVRFGSAASIGAPLTVVADDEPRWPVGFDRSQVSFETRGGRSCHEA
jgi:cytoskeletal protein CcmA (bactofilin family)